MLELPLALVYQQLSLIRLLMDNLKKNLYELTVVWTKIAFSILNVVNEVQSETILIASGLCPKLH